MKRKDLLSNDQLAKVSDFRIDNFEFIDFTINQGAMSQNVERGVVELVCEASDFNQKGFNTLGIIAKCPKGTIIFKFDKYDYYGSGEDREIAGARYVSKNKEFKLLIIND